MELSKMSTDAVIQRWRDATWSQGDPDPARDEAQELGDEIARRLVEAEARERQWFDGEKRIELDPAEVRRRREEAGRKLARLPKTADGMVVAPGDRVYWFSGYSPEQPILELVFRSGHSAAQENPRRNAHRVCQCYSTREAAAAARVVGD